MGRLSNISLALMRTFLMHHGLTLVRTKGGHEVWQKEGMPRPVVIQSHIDPVPEMVIRKNLRSMGLGVNDLLAFIQSR